MTTSIGFADASMLWLVRQQDIEFNTLPFAGFRERKGVFLCVWRISAMNFCIMLLFNLRQPIKAYRFKDLEEWLYAHLNQPMNPEKMTAEIMEFGYIERYYDRMTGQVNLNDWLQGYGVKIVSDRDRKRGENYQKMYWKLIELRQNL